MKLSEQDRDLIERGILDDLSPEEKMSFEQKLNDNEEFRLAVNLQRRMLASLEANEKVKLKHELKSIFANMESDSRQSRRVPVKWYWLAASFMVILASVGWLNLRNSTGDIFNEYFDPYPAQNTVRGEISKRMEQEILRFYGQGDYHQVIELMETPSGPPVDFKGAQLYLGNALLAVGRVDGAIEIFEQFQKSGQYYTDAQWYLALSHLKKGDKTSAITVLQSLLNERSIYWSSTKELLEELN